MARECSEEIYSKKNLLAGDRTLVKVLFYNIVRQTRIPAGIGTVDANNCYDWIAYPIASLLFQSLGVPKEACNSIFRTIQDMFFFFARDLGIPKTLLVQLGK
jgi:hypothetical protein